VKFTLLIAVAGILALFRTVHAHPDHEEAGLLAHWAVGARMGEGGYVEDVEHGLKAQVRGQPKLITRGPSQGWWLDGAFSYLLVSEDHNSIAEHLPKREMSVTAWVNMSSLHRWGGIHGAFQDNGNQEAGWNLGYNESNFSFALATTGGDDGDGRLTYLNGKTTIEPGRWYFVAATYDGTIMRLYVNGELDAESAEQSGDILYPAKAPVTIGCYKDRDEKNPMDGVIHRVKLYNRALADEELKAAAEKNRNMIAYDPKSADEMRFLVQPFLQFATQNSISVVSESSKPSRAVVEYGKQQPLEQSVVVDSLQEIATVRLTGLEPETTYFYRVLRTDDAGRFLASPIRSFQTAVRDDTPWAFGVIGDTQRNPEVTRRCAEGIYGLRPNFVMHCGDVVDDGFAKNQWLQDLFEPSARLIAHVPIFPVIGNHENDSRFYYDYFDLPRPEYYYTFRYGNAQFFMIDTNRDCSPGSEQYNWLKEELSRSTAKWKFACHHHPCWSSDNDDYGDSVKGDPEKLPRTFGDIKARALIELYEKYGLDIGFAGHIHSYERTWPILQMSINMKNGVRYIVSGGGGGGLEEPAPNRTWFQKHVKRAHHYCFATIHGGSLQFYAYDEDGRLFDTFELNKD
jgi:hypothetical protein